MPKPVAKLARGAENEVHSKAAVAAQRQSAKAKPVAAAKAAPAPKAVKAKAPSTGTDYAYKVTGKCDRKEGTWTYHMLTIICANKSTDSAKAAHVKSGVYASNKLDFKWAIAKGYISPVA